MLVEHGHGDIAWHMLTKTSYPSFGFMIAEGATTLWENWAKEKGSHCHPMYGSVSAWFYRVLAGLQLDDAAPAFKHFRVRPHFLGDLTSAAASVATIRGGSRRTLAARRRHPHRTPHRPRRQRCHASSCAATRSMIVREGEQLLWDGAGSHDGIAGIRGCRVANAMITIEVGGGRYCFAVKEEQERS